MIRNRKAVTIVEILVTIAIIGVLIALLVPAIQKSRDAAGRAACLSNLRQIGLAIHAFEAREKRIPFNQYGGQFGVGRTSKAWSWMVRILPDIEKRDVFLKGDIEALTLGTSPLTGQTVNTFLCPLDASSHLGPRLDAGNLKGVAVGRTNYKGVSGANWGDALRGKKLVPIPTDWRNGGANNSFDGHNNGDGVFFRTDFRRRLRLSQLTDGQSNTTMVGEDVSDKTYWCSWPYSNNANGTCAIPPNARRRDGSEYDADNWENNESFRSCHNGGVHFSFGDCSGRFIKDTISLDVYRALATIKGGERIGIGVD